MKCGFVALATLGMATFLPSVAKAADRLVLIVDDPGARAAAGDLVPALTTALQRKGYDVVRGPEGSPGGAEVRKLRDELKATAIMQVTVGFLLGQQPRSKGPEAKPAVGFVAREFDERGTIWRNALGYLDDEPAPADTPLRKRRPLLARAATRLFWPLPPGQGVALATAEEDFEDVTGTVAIQRGPTLDYDVLLERLRAQRTGPRFRLRVSRNQAQ